MSLVEPLVPNLPAATTGLSRSLNRDLPAIQAQFSPTTVNAYLNFVRTRASRGLSPLTPQQSVSILRSAESGRAATKSTERSSSPLDFLGNVASDIGEIVSSIPKLPEALINEARDLPNFSKRVQQAGGGIEGLLAAPGIRLIPGAYTARNLIKGDFNEIVSHPVMTALDVLPYASKFEVGRRIGEINVGDTTVGDVAQTAKNAVKRTLPGRIARQTWGLDTRGVSRIIAEKAAEAVRQANPSLSRIFTSELSDIQREGTRAGIELNKAVGGDEVRHAAIYDAAESGQLDSFDMTDPERAAVNRVMDVRDKYRQYLLDAGEIQQRTISGVTEEFSNPQAKRIDKLDATLQRQRTFTQLRTAITEPAVADLEALHTQVTSQLQSELPGGVKKKIAAGYVHALDAAGYETPATLPKLTGPALDEFVASTNPSTLGRRAEGVATKTMRQKAATTWISDNRKYTEKSLASLEERVTKAQARVIPSRWTPLLEKTKNASVRDALETRIAADDPNLASILQLADERQYGMLKSRGLISTDELRKYESEAIQTISQLREQGINPEFVHHVAPGAAKAMAHPTMSTMVPKPSQVKARVNDWTPTTKNLSVAISHQGLELAREALSKEAVSAIRDAYTHPLSQVQEEYLPVARRAAARRSTTVQAEMERLIGRDYVRFTDTENGFVAGQARPPKFTEMQSMSPEELLIPRHLSDALMQVSSPSVVSRLFDPVLKVFRYSVLPFSPRFHVNNIGGGAIMSALEDPRVLTKLNKGFQLARDNYKMIKALGKGEDAALPERSAAALESMTPSMRAQLGSLEFSVAPEDLSHLHPESLFKFKAGQQLGKMFGTVGKAVGRAADWSYGINQLFDDMYRGAAYFSGHDRGLAKGMTAEEAARAGEELVNKIQPRWLEMTPMERSILRPFVPFYSFMSHVFRYAMRYPVDHPWRTSVMGSFARTEMEDFNTGLPQALASAFFLGSPDEHGDQTAIDIGAMNPFRNFGDDLTLAGFLSETNPVFKVALGQLGYDPAARGPDLYPELTYDPKTGRFKAQPTDTPGLIGQLVTGFIPQAKIIGALTGTSSEFKQMMRSNPDAATRMLLSSAGVPILWKNVNVPQEQFTTELNRERSQQETLAAAMKSGDYREARKWPGLVPLIKQLETLGAAGKLESFKAPADPNSILDQSQAQLASRFA